MRKGLRNYGKNVSAAAVEVGWSIEVEDETEKSWVEKVSMVKEDDLIAHAVARGEKTWDESDIIALLGLDGEDSRQVAQRAERIAQEVAAAAEASLAASQEQ